MIILVCFFFALVIKHSFSHIVLQKPIGIHIDAEPHVLDEWDEDLNQTANNYLDLMEKINRKIKENHTDELQLSLDIPFWYDSDKRIVERNGLSKQFFEFITEYTDVLTLMDYSNDYERIISNAENEINIMKELGKKVIIGLNTKCNGDNPETTSYCDFSTRLEEDIDKVNEYFNGNSGFGGIAIHSLKYYQGLSFPSNQTKNRDLWIWSSSGIYEETQAERLQFLEENKIGTVYLSSLSQLLYDVEPLLKMLNETAKLGIKVELLFAKNSWVDPVEGHDIALKQIQDTLDFFDSLEVPKKEEEEEKEKEEENSTNGKSVCIYFLVFLVFILF